MFYNFITSNEIRDRKVTARVFEDFISTLFSGITCDETYKKNPKTPSHIKDYDLLCSGLEWKISDDLAGNKREKADSSFGEYFLSLKTLKGKLYDENLNIVDSSYNKELNIGSVSFRALLIGLVSDEQLNNLSDRKGGLGSKPQLIKNIYEPLLKSGKWNDFIDRLEVFLKYIYSECDLLVVFKGGYKMELLFISDIDFIETLIEVARENYNEFFKIFYRWENNNLRIHYDNLFERLEKKGKLRRVNLKLNNINQNKKFRNKLEKIKMNLKKAILMP